MLRNFDEKYYLDGEILKVYYDYVREIQKYVTKGDSVYNALNQKYGEYNFHELNVVHDLSSIKAEQFLYDLDHIINVWTKRPWHDLYPKDYFLRYVLPLRVGTEIPEYDRSRYHNLYNYLIDSLIENNIHSIYSAARAVNEKMIEENWIFTQRYRHSRISGQALWLKTESETVGI